MNELRTDRWLQNSSAAFDFNTRVLQFVEWGRNKSAANIALQLWLM